MIIQFATSNPNKLLEARRLLGWRVEQLDIDLPEIQAVSLDAIVLDKLDLASSRATRDWVVVEDVGLGLDAAGGFPGPYIRWLLECAGGKALAAFAAGLEDPSATARCVLGLAGEGRRTLFHGEIRGRILPEPRGTSGFGWDPWFQPEGSPLTFGEMSGDEKDRISHRSLAWAGLAEFLDSV